jgi:hypothetical protein
MADRIRSDSEVKKIIVVVDGSYTAAIIVTQVHSQRFRFLLVDKTGISLLAAVV